MEVDERRFPRRLEENRFERLSPLGEDDNPGQGVVGLYRDRRQHDREVVLKVFEFDALLPEPARIARARFDREAQFSTQVQHSGVMPVFETGFFPDGRGVVVMQYLPGARSLAAELRGWDPQNRWSLELVANATRQLAEALTAVHAEGILHRDVKPANVILTGSTTNLRAMLTDFGAAKSMSDAGDDVTRSGVVMGTSRFVAPERQKGFDVCAGDQYSLAVTVMAMLATRDRSASTGQLENLSARSSEIGSVLSRALDADPGERWPSLEAFSSAFSRAVEAPDNPLPRVPTTAPAVHNGRAIPQSRPPVSRPQRAIKEFDEGQVIVMVLIGVATAIVIIALAVLNGGS